MVLGMGPLAAAAGGPAGAAGVADGRVRHQLRLPRCTYSLQVKGNQVLLIGGRLEDGTISFNVLDHRFWIRPLL